MTVFLWMFMFCGSKVSFLTQSFFFFPFQQRAYFFLTSGFAEGISYEIILNWQLTSCIKNNSRHLSSLHRKEVFSLSAIFSFFILGLTFLKSYYRLLLCDCDLRRALIKIKHANISVNHRHYEHCKARNHLIK